MDTFNLFSAVKGNDFNTVLGLNLLKSITQKDIQHLKALGIEKVSDLLCFKPIHDAQLLLLIARGELAHDFDISTLVNESSISLKDLPNQDVELIKNIGPSSKAHLNALGVFLIKDLAEYPFFKEAEQLIIKSSNYFSEPPSAPDELIPKLKGSVHSIARFNSFIKNRTILTPIIEREKTNQNDNDFDSSIKDMFLQKAFSRRNKAVYQIHLGYIASYVQKWVFVNSHLGELLHSLPLAPGESRNIMMLSWTGKQAAKRYEATQTDEKLSNSLYHHRALDEVTSATAHEHLQGMTLDVNAMGGSSHSATFGMGNATGAGGSATIPIGGVPVNLAGLASNSAGVGTGSVFSSGIQVGTIYSSTEGDREVQGKLMQNITELTSQKASNLRSLWSTIIVEDEQTYSKEALTRNITNYNHSHALTIQYFEVLHHYKTEVELKSTTPVLFLPFNPINFNIHVIKKYWHLFRNSFPDSEVREIYDRLMKSVMDETGKGDAKKIDLENSPKIKQISFNISISGNEYKQVGLDTLRFHNLKVDFKGLSKNYSHSKELGQFGFTWNMNEDVKKISINLSKYDDVQSDLWVVDFVAKIVVRDEAGNEKDKYIKREKIDFLGSAYSIEVTEKEIFEDSYTSVNAIAEIENYFKSNQYFFTKILIQNIEREQLIDMVEELYFKFDSINVFLTELIEPEPLAYANNYLLFRVKNSITNRKSKTLLNPQLIENISNALNSSINTPSIFPNIIGSRLGSLDWLEKIPAKGSEVKFFFENLIDYVECVNQIPFDPEVKPLPVVDDIYLPSKGIFAEAVLGRSNASEKIDITRFYNWQDSPIPHLAPGISNVDSNTPPSPPIQTGPPNIPNSVLNIVSPPAFPDPTGLTSSLLAIQNGNMFRDMSKSSELVDVMANLSQFASKLAEMSSKLSGDSRKEALQSATEIAKVVAEMVPNKNLTMSNSKTPKTPTEQGGTINALENIKKDNNLPPKEMDQAKVQAAGGNIITNEKNSSPQPTLSTGNQSVPSSSTSIKSYQFNPYSDAPLSPDSMMGGRSIWKDALKMGDIILSTTSSKISDIIQLSTNSPISHAMLYVGDGLVVEAILEGVVNRTLEEALFESSVAVVARFPGLTEQQQSVIRDFAGEQVGKRYDFYAAIQSPDFVKDHNICNLLSSEKAKKECLKWKGKIDLGMRLFGIGEDNSFFCSELVLRAYQEAGIKLTTTEPEYSPPSKILTMMLKKQLIYVGHLKYFE